MTTRDAFREAGKIGSTLPLERRRARKSLGGIFVWRWKAGKRKLVRFSYSDCIRKDKDVLPI